MLGNIDSGRETLRVDIDRKKKTLSNWPKVNYPFGNAYTTLLEITLGTATSGDIPTMTLKDWVEKLYGILYLGVEDDLWPGDRGTAVDSRLVMFHKGATWPAMIRALVGSMPDHLRLGRQEILRTMRHAIKAARITVVPGETNKTMTAKRIMTLLDTANLRTIHRTVRRDTLGIDVPINSLPMVIQYGVDVMERLARGAGANDMADMILDYMEAYRLDNYQVQVLIILVIVWGKLTPPPTLDTAPHNVNKGVIRQKSNTKERWQWAAVFFIKGLFYIYPSVSTDKLKSKANDRFFGQHKVNTRWLVDCGFVKPKKDGDRPSYRLNEVESLPMGDYQRKAIPWQRALRAANLANVVEDIMTREVKNTVCGGENGVIDDWKEEVLSKCTKDAYDDIKKLLS